MPKKIWIPAAVVLLLILALFLWEPVLDALPIDQSHWVGVDGSLYHVGEKGDRDMGWYEEGGNRYYLDPARSGAMVTGWTQIDGKAYHFSDAGLLLTGWLETGDGRQYLGTDGIMVTGWQDIDGARYFFDEAGFAHTGWYEEGGEAYYLDENGVMATGWIDLDDGRHYLTESGAAAEGWQFLNGVRCYLDNRGTVLTGWQDIGSSRYYFNDQGMVHTGWLELDGEHYYLDETGIMVTGWLEVDGTSYYLLEDGTAARGRQEIDGQTHYFTSTGANILLVNRWNPLPEDHTVETVSVGGVNVAPECAEALEKMLADCQAAGHGYRITSGYRTISRQKTLLQNKIDQIKADGYDADTAYAKAIQIVAIPGTSEHHLGLAVDIVDSSYVLMNRNQAETDTQKWLMEHCWDYGFILRYPDGTTEATGIIYEPWHYRYVGLELAQEMKEFGGCLEDYLDMLTGGGVTCGGRGE